MERHCGAAKGGQEFRMEVKNESSYGEIKVKRSAGHCLHVSLHPGMLPNHVDDVLQYESA